MKISKALFFFIFIKILIFLKTRSFEDVIEEKDKNHKTETWE